MYDPQLEGLVRDARAVRCAELAGREGWQLKRHGHNLIGPCPKCGGKDRFGINTAEDKWNCRGCGLGGHDAISLVQLLWSGLKGRTMGETFLEACEIVSGRKRSDVISEEERKRRDADFEAKKAAQEAESEKRRLAARQSAYRVWRRARPPSEALEAYLAVRGLGGADMDALIAGGSLREIPDLEFWHRDDDNLNRRLHQGLAMVAAIRWLDDRGTFGGVHRTWIDVGKPKGKAVIIHQGEALDVKKVLGSMGNGAIRLITPAEPWRMVVGEGIETTLTPWRHDFHAETAYWAGITMGHIAGRAGRDAETGKRMPELPDLEDVKCLAIPPTIRELVLLGETSADKAKAKKMRQEYIRAARRQKRLRPDLTVRIAWPDGDDDFNAVAMALHGEAAVHAEEREDR